MPKVSSNNISLAFTVEPSLGVAGSEWFLLEPNDNPTLGDTVVTTARNPISRDRQRRKGLVTDLDNATNIAQDLTVSAFRDFVEGFMFAKGVNRDVSQQASDAAIDGGASEDSFSIAALTADQSAKFNVSSLLWVSGFSVAQNNGLFEIAIAAAPGDSALSVPTGSLTAETGQEGLISFAGYRVPAGVNPTWSWDAVASRGTLAATGLGTQLQTLGLTKGQLVHIGSALTTQDMTVSRAFTNVMANDIYGYGRVMDIQADFIILDKVSDTLKFSDLTAPAAEVDILFGEFYRNVPVGDPDYLEQSFQFELESPDLLGPGLSGFEYTKGSYCSQITFNIPLTNKSDLSYAFIGLSTDLPVGVADRKSGADTAATPKLTTGFSSSVDVARLRVQNVDDSGLTTDFKNVTFTLNNNVSGEKVIANLGAKFLNLGNLEVGLDTQLIFTNAEVIKAIKNNETVTMDFIMKNDEGVIAVDIPSMTLGGGGREYPENESVLLNVTSEAFKDKTLGTSVGISVLPSYIPD